MTAPSVAWDSLLATAYKPRGRSHGHERSALAARAVHHVKVLTPLTPRGHAKLVAREPDESLCGRVRADAWAEYADGMPAAEKRCPACVKAARTLGLDPDTIPTVEDLWDAPSKEVHRGA